MGASGWGEKGKKVSGDTGRGYEQEVSREPPSPAPLQATAQSRAEDKEEMTDWGGVGVGEERALFWEEIGVPKTSWAGPGYLRSISIQVKKCF